MGYLFVVGENTIYYIHNTPSVNVKTTNCLRILDHHPWLGSVPNKKCLSLPAGRENLNYALSELAVKLGLHEGDVLRFVTTRFCSNRFGTIN